MTDQTSNLPRINPDALAIQVQIRTSMDALIALAVADVLAITPEQAAQIAADPSICAEGTPIDFAKQYVFERYVEWTDDALDFEQRLSDALDDALDLDDLPFDPRDPDDDDPEFEQMYPQPAGTIVVQGTDPHYLLPDRDRSATR